MNSQVARWIAGATLIAACHGAVLAQSADTESSRIAAAEKLFLAPAYRQVATRQIYETVNSLPPEQSKAALQALRDPSVVQAMRQVITRAMAGTYGVKELEFLQKVFNSPEMETFVKRENIFRDQMQREFTAAIMTNPALIGRIPVLTGK